MTRPIVLALVATLVLASCGNDDEPVIEGAAPSTETTAPTTTARPGTTAPTTSTDRAEPCPQAVEVPASASQVLEASGQLDGDGTADVLRTFLAEDTWWLQVELSVGGGAALELAGTQAGAVGIAGGADVDGDGTDEIWARVGSGASATILGLVRFDDCSLLRVTTESGLPVELPVGGSVGAAAGVECRADEVDVDLTVFSALHREELTYDVTATGYRLEGSRLVAGTSATDTVEADDAAFVRATSFTCHELVL